MYIKTHVHHTDRIAYLSTEKYQLVTLPTEQSILQWIMFWVRLPNVSGLATLPCISQDSGDEKARIS